MHQVLFILGVVLLFILFVFLLNFINLRIIDGLLFILFGTFFITGMSLMIRMIFSKKEVKTNKIGNIYLRIIFGVLFFIEIISVFTGF